MHSFDPELVAALAEGTLEPAEASTLAARIAADPAAAADLAGQRAALAAIRSATSPRLDERERIALHAAVAEQLGLTADSAMAATRPRHRVAWGPIAVAATTLVAVIAFAPTLLDVDRGGNDAMVTADGATTVTTTDPENESAPLGAQTPPEPALSSADATDGGSLPAGDAFATTTLAAAMMERAASLPKVAEDLILLKSDPEALAMLGYPVDDTTACAAEAIEFLGSSQLTTFDYSTESTDPGSTAITYVVFHLAPADSAEPGTLVAFDPADCSLPIVVP